MESLITGEMDEVQQSWDNAAVLCFVNFIAGLMVAAFTGYSAPTTVPIVVTAAGALANSIYGFTAVGFLANDITHSTALAETEAIHGYVAATFLADMFWLVSQPSPFHGISLGGTHVDIQVLSRTIQVQEAGINFYSYFILVQLLRRRARLAFMAVFWCFAVAITTVRTSIAAFRVRTVLGTGSITNNSNVVYYLHVLFFVLIAFLEIIAFCTLLLKFYSASRISSRERLPPKTLYPCLMKSTILRLGMLVLVGISRTITFSFLLSNHETYSTARTADTCAYIVECAFPIII